jgi:hypothetical protein
VVCECGCLPGLDSRREKENLRLIILKLVQGEFTQRGEMATPRKTNPFNFEEDFFEAFSLMKEMVEELYNERGQRRGEGTSQVKNEDDHPSQKTSPPSFLLFSPSPSHSPSLSRSPSPHKKIAPKKPLLKLDVKFDLPMYNGELNAERLDNWIRQIEVYCHVQQIDEEEVKIQLASLDLKVQH